MLLWSRDQQNCQIVWFWFARVVAMIYPSKSRPYNSFHGQFSWSQFCDCKTAHGSKVWQHFCCNWLLNKSSYNFPETWQWKIHHKCTHTHLLLNKKIELKGWNDKESSSKVIPINFSNICYTRATSVLNIILAVLTISAAKMHRAITKCVQAEIILQKLNKKNKEKNVPDMSKLV